ncbi:MAG: DUF3140 domain-containing protein [Comamonadaceae bacterium]|nr:MAG: DUF3140 domain-containing protein [Comamonadaceae bacterium]
MSAAATLDTPAEVRTEFHRAVNMTPAQLERWLDSDESRAVGITHDGEHESVGHQSGRRIVQLLRKKAADLDDDDLAHMRKVIGYVHRHLKQKPAHPEHSRWRASLMNWGHDPMK